MVYLEGLGSLKRAASVRDLCLPLCCPAHANKNVDRRRRQVRLSADQRYEDWQHGVNDRLVWVHILSPAMGVSQSVHAVKIIILIMRMACIIDKFIWDFQSVYSPPECDSEGSGCRS